MPISQKWKDTIKDGIKNQDWDAYDSIIKREVDGYAKKFTALKSKVDWKLIKAMLWTESGGPSNKAWKTRPLQIGNVGDPAYAVLKNAEEGSDLIMSSALAALIKNSSIDKPETNIKAGIAYLYTRMAITNIVSVRDLVDSKVYEYTIVRGDNLSKIAKKVGTTIFELRRLNPSASGVIMPGKKLKYVKAVMKRSILGWDDFTAENAAKKYNGGGDMDYAAKLNYILNEVFPKLERKTK